MHFFDLFSVFSNKCYAKIVIETSFDIELTKATI